MDVFYAVLIQMSGEVLPLRLKIDSAKLLLQKCMEARLFIQVKLLLCELKYYHEGTSIWFEGARDLCQWTVPRPGIKVGLKLREKTVM